jgi:hypothetical protein
MKHREMQDFLQPQAAGNQNNIPTGLFKPLQGLYMIIFTYMLMHGIMLYHFHIHSLLHRRTLTRAEAAGSPAGQPGRGIRKMDQ